MVDRSGNRFIHSINPYKEWWGGFPGELFRYRNVALTTGLQFAGAIGVSAYGLWQWAIAIAVVATTLCLCMLYIRRLKLSALKADEAIHAFFHDLRDGVTDIVRAENSRERATKVQGLLDKCVENVAVVFQKRKCDDTVNVILRLAEPDDAGEVQYYTASRSSGLDRDRRKNSQALRADEGIARALQEKNCVGAFLIRDVTEAVEKGIWRPSENDKLGDANCVIAIPVNGWIDDEMAMIGIVHLTSQRMSLVPTDWVLLKAFTDALGFALPIINDYSEMYMQEDDGTEAASERP